MEERPIRFSIVTRSQSRQGSVTDENSSVQSFEELGQRLDSVFEGQSWDSERRSEELGSPELIEESLSTEVKEVEMAEARTPLGIAPPKFRGGSEENAEEYLQAFERVARANGWNDDKKLVVMPCYLEGAALKWYENLERAEGDGLTWVIVKQRMKGAFQSIAWEEQLEYKLRMRMQGEEEQVESYLQDVINLCTKLDPEMNERIKIKHVLRGLKPSLLEKVMIMENDTLEALLNNIRKVQTARYMAGQRVDQLLSAEPVREIRLGVAVPSPQVSTTSIESKLENLTSEFAKFSMRLLEERDRERHQEDNKNERGIGQREVNRGRGVYSGPQRGVSRGRTADGRVICYKCNRVGHFAINCRSNQVRGSGNERGEH